jgi:hypothetical protein
LVKFGGFDPLLAAKTKEVKTDVEGKTQHLFDLVQKVKNGTFQLKAEE